jgi:hypothetical protein
MRAASKRFSCALISTHCQCIILFKIEADYIHDKHYQQEYYHDILSQKITASPFTRTRIGHTSAKWPKRSFSK